MKLRLLEQRKRCQRLPSTLPVAAIMLTVFARALYATDQVVTDFGDSGNANQLRAKLTALQSSGGGTLTFVGGPATVVLLNGVLPAITTNSSIDGGGNITISGANATYIFGIESGGTLTLNNLTVTRGFNGGDDGGAIRNFGTLSINSCKFLTNEAAAGFSGGAIVTYGPLNITNSEFGSNKAGNGGAIYPRFAPAVTNITGSNFHDNAATNTSNGWGGAMLLWDGAPVTVRNSAIHDNTARHGGAIYVFNNSSLTLNDSQLTNNIIDNGTAGNNRGGAILNAGGAALTNVTITGNQVKEPTTFTSDRRGGAGIANLDTGVMTITKCRISDNQGRWGGGIANFGTLTLSDATIATNHAGVGGAIYNVRAGGNVAAVTITGSTLNGNTVSFFQFPDVVTPGGSAIFNDTGILRITNSTMSGNTGDSAIKEHNSSITLLNLTIANNSGGGLGSDQSPNTSVVSVKNTLVVNNNGNDCGPIFFNTFTGQFSISSDSTCSWVGSGNQVAPNPMLGTLADNGGPTQTQLPQPNSPAIDNGTGDGAPARDQRGYVRAGSAPDVGAAESSGTLPVSLANISTRGFVDIGDNVMIGGFFVAGTGNKLLLLRAIGPSLGNPPINLSNALPDPTLSLFSGSTRIEFNDNWADASNASSIDPGLRPGNGTESAILTSLPPGPYTAIVRGANDGTGIGLVEVFDLDPTAASKLSNISTRGLVETGDGVLIGGFNVRGPDSEKVVIRAIGPSLADAPFNLTNVLQNPTVSLFNDQGSRIQFNDDWQSDQKDEIIATGLQPSNTAESALIRTLTPGNYTAIVNGVNGTTGIALVEVYGLN